MKLNFSRNDLLFLLFFFLTGCVTTFIFENLLWGISFLLLFLGLTALFHVLRSLPLPFEKHVRKVIESNKNFAEKVDIIQTVTRKNAESIENLKSSNSLFSTQLQRIEGEIEAIEVIQKRQKIFISQFRQFEKYSRSQLKELSSEVKVSRTGLERSMASFSEQIRAILEQLEKKVINTSLRNSESSKELLLEIKKTVQTLDDYFSSQQDKMGTVENKMIAIDSRQGEIESIALRIRESIVNHSESSSIGLNELKKNADRLISLTQKDFQNQFRQYESLLSLYHLLPDMKFLPTTRGWAGSPDFLAKVAELILKKSPNFIVEAGSGVSSIIMGEAIRMNKAGNIISLEHKEEFANITRSDCLLNNLEDELDIIYTPLKGYSLNGKKWLWYSLDGLNLSKEIDMLVVDGPPGDTQKLARYPAVPLLLPYFAEHVTIVLDDSNRKDESETVEKWCELLNEKGLNFSVENFWRFEKGMVVIEVFSAPYGGDVF